MRISPARIPGEDGFSEETKAFLALIRSIPEVPEEDDPNGWFHQICDHLKRSPRERMERWVWFVDGSLRSHAERRGLEHVPFDPVRVLRALSSQRVVFVLVGMGAGYLRGVPYPNYNTDITPRTDPGNIARLERALGVLEGRPLERDEWGPVAQHTLPGFRRLLTSAGMVNVVAAVPGVGDYEQVIEKADFFDVAEGLSVPVASLKDVIRSKEAVGALVVGTPPYSRMMDGVHVLMGEETLTLRKKYGTKWNLATA